MIKIIFCLLALILSFSSKNLFAQSLDQLDPELSKIEFNFQSRAVILGTDFFACFQNGQQVSEANLNPRDPYCILSVSVSPRDDEKALILKKNGPYRVSSTEDEGVNSLDKVTKRKEDQRHSVIVNFQQQRANCADCIERMWCSSMGHRPTEDDFKKSLGDLVKNSTFAYKEQVRPLPHVPGAISNPKDQGQSI